MIRGLLVDAVGTVITLRQSVPEVYAQIAASFGFRVGPEQVAQRLQGHKIGPPALEGLALAEIPAHERLGWREVVRIALGDGAADGPCFDALWHHYAGAEAWQTTPSCESALQGARRAGLRVGLLSNMDARLPPLLEALGLGGLFDAQVLPSTHGCAKPDPRAFELALAALGLEAAETLYIGDRDADCVEAARSAGLQALRLGHGLRSWNDLAAWLS